MSDERVAFEATLNVTFKPMSDLDSVWWAVYSFDGRHLFDIARPEYVDVTTPLPPWEDPFGFGLSEHEARVLVKTYSGYSSHSLGKIAARYAEALEE